LKKTKKKTNNMSEDKKQAPPQKKIKISTTWCRFSSRRFIRSS